MSIEKKKFKKLYRELQYQQSELDYVLEILKEAHIEFEQYHRQYCTEKQIDLKGLNKKHKDKVKKTLVHPKKQKHDEDGILNINDKTDMIDNTDTKEFKRIYREIAKLLHPDKGGDEIQFKKASDAMANKEWGVLLEICEKHNISISNYKSINKILKKKIEGTKKKIKQQKSTYSWLLYMCDDKETCKHNVVKKFLKHLFQYGDYK